LHLGDRELNKILAVCGIAGFASAVLAANAIPQIPAPKATGQCVRYDHLPPVCGYVVFLTSEQVETVQALHRQNVQTFINAQ